MHKNCNHQNCRRQEFEIYFVLFRPVVWNVLIFAVEIESCKVLRCSNIPASLRGRIPTERLVKSSRCNRQWPVIESSNRAIKINWTRHWADSHACLLFPTPKFGARMSRLFGRLVQNPKCSPDDNDINSLFSATQLPLGLSPTSHMFFVYDLLFYDERPRNRRLRIETMRDLREAHNDPAERTISSCYAFWSTERMYTL